MFGCFDWFEWDWREAVFPRGGAELAEVCVVGVQFELQAAFSLETQRARADVVPTSTIQNKLFTERMVAIVDLRELRAFA